MIKYIVLSFSLRQDLQDYTDKPFFVLIRVSSWFSVPPSATLRDCFVVNKECRVMEIFSGICQTFNNIVRIIYNELVCHI
jgi:hypothetical protein